MKIYSRNLCLSGDPPLCSGSGSYAIFHLLVLSDGGHEVARTHLTMIVTMMAGKRLRDRPPFGSNAYIHVMTQTIWVVSTYIFIFSALLFDSGYFCVQSLPLQIGKILPISRSNTLARIDGYDRTETCVRLPVGQYDHYPKNRKLALSEFRFFFQRKFGSCTQNVVKNSCQTELRQKRVPRCTWFWTHGSVVPTSDHLLASIHSIGKKVLEINRVKISQLGFGITARKSWPLL